MIYPTEPTNEQIEANAWIEWDGKRGFACWYPQMGGYVGKCIVHPLQDGCFDAYIWHDGEFPIGDGEGQILISIHHCDADQFIEFGKLVKSRMPE